MARRTHQHEIIRAVAKCDRCTFSVQGKNAQALAAQHHDRKHHRTHVEITTRITYGAQFGATSKGEKQGDLLK